MATAKKSARKSSARKSASKSGAKAGAKSARGEKARHPLSAELVDGDRAKDPTVGKNVATAPKTSKDARGAKSVDVGMKGRSVPAGTTVESQRRGSGNPPGPLTTDADRKALADREKHEARRNEEAATATR